MQVTKFSTNSKGTICWPNCNQIDLVTVVFILAAETTQVLDSIIWVRCTSGNVFLIWVRHNCRIVVSNLFGFFDCQRRLLTQRRLLYCDHCSNPGLPIDCHDWLLPLHTIAITHRHCLGSFTFTPAKNLNCPAPVKNWDKHQNIIQECPLVATTSCPHYRRLLGIIHFFTNTWLLSIVAWEKSSKSFGFFCSCKSDRVKYLAKSKSQKWVLKVWYLWQNQTVDISVTEQIVVAKSKPNVLHLKWRFDGVWWKLGINLEGIGNKLEEK